MSELLPCFEVEPRGEARASIVWMHGLGASGHDFEDVVPMLALPHARFVFPHAPQHAVTINGGLIMPAWYDIRSLAVKVSVMCAPPGAALRTPLTSATKRTSLL